MSFITKEKKREYAQRDYLKRKAYIDNKTKDYALKNIDKLKAYRKKYYWDNVEKIRLKKKLYSQNNKEKIRNKSKLWRQSEHYKKDIIPKLRERSILNRLRTRLSILKRINPNLSCNKCSYNKDIRVLHIDHVFGNGNIDRKSFKDGHSYYKHLLTIENISEKYQLLCANCNWLKRYENRELFWKSKRRELCQKG